VGSVLCKRDRQSRHGIPGFCAYTLAAQSAFTE
jgi:hypothetical protein